MVKKHPWRAVQLRYDDTFRAVDDECAGFRHQRQVTHVNFLLLDVFDRLDLGGTFPVINNQADFHPQGCAIRHTPQFALFHIENRSTQLVADVFKRCIARIGNDGKDRFQSAMEATLTLIVLGHFKLQKFPVGTNLRFQQVRHLENGLAFAEVLANALFFRERVTHVPIPPIYDQNS